MVDKKGVRVVCDICKHEDRINLLVNGGIKFSSVPCPECGYHAFVRKFNGKTMKIMKPPIRKSIKFNWCGDKHTGKTHGNYFIKPRYLGKHVKIDLKDRTAVVRLMMNAFYKHDYTPQEAKAITEFLKRKHLSRAERHAVMFSLGYRYKKTNERRLSNLQINGYFPYKKPQKPKLITAYTWRGKNLIVLTQVNGGKQPIRRRETSKK